MTETQAETEVRVFHCALEFALLLFTLLNLTRGLSPS